MQLNLHQELKSQKISYMSSMFPFSLCTCFPAIPLIVRYSYLTERNKTSMKYSNHCWTKPCKYYCFVPKSCLTDFYCQILNWHENTRKCTFTEWDVAYRRRNQLRCSSDVQDENQGTWPHFLSHICIWQTQGKCISHNSGRKNVETDRGIIIWQKANNAIVHTLVPPVNSDSSLYSFIVYSLSSLLPFFHKLAVKRISLC